MSWFTKLINGRSGPAAKDPDYYEEGTVLLQALITKEGRIARTMVVRSVSAFDEEAVRAVEQWRFKPARSSGQPLAVWVAIPVKFSLN